MKIKGIKYCVIQFLKKPYENINKYVCVPGGWVSSRKKSYSKVFVRYPSEKLLMSKYVKRRGKFKKDWKFYSAKVEYITDVYSEAVLVSIQLKHDYQFGSSLRPRARKLFSQKSSVTKFDFQYNKTDEANMHLENLAIEYHSTMESSNIENSSPDYRNCLHQDELNAGKNIKLNKIETRPYLKRDMKSETTIQNVNKSSQTPSNFLYKNRSSSQSTNSLIREQETLHNSSTTKNAGLPIKKFSLTPPNYLYKNQCSSQSTNSLITEQETLHNSSTTKDAGLPIKKILNTYTEQYPQNPKNYASQFSRRLEHQELRAHEMIVERRNELISKNQRTNHELISVNLENLKIESHPIMESLNIQNTSPDNRKNTELNRTEQRSYLESRVKIEPTIESSANLVNLPVAPSNYLYENQFSSQSTNSLLNEQETWHNSLRIKDACRNQPEKIGSTYTEQYAINNLSQFSRSSDHQRLHEHEMIVERRNELTNKIQRTNYDFTNVHLEDLAIESHPTMEMSNIENTSPENRKNTEINRTEQRSYLESRVKIEPTIESSTNLVNQPIAPSNYLNESPFSSQFTNSLQRRNAFTGQYSQNSINHLSHFSENTNHQKIQAQGMIPRSRNELISKPQRSMHNFTNISSQSSQLSKHLYDSQFHYSGSNKQELLQGPHAMKDINHQMQPPHRNANSTFTSRNHQPVIQSSHFFAHTNQGNCPPTYHNLRHELHSQDIVVEKSKESDRVNQRTDYKTDTNCAAANFNLTNFIGQPSHSSTYLHGPQYYLHKRDYLYSEQYKQEMARKAHHHQQDDLCRRIRINTSAVPSFQSLTNKCCQSFECSHQHQSPLTAYLHYELRKHILGRRCTAVHNVDERFITSNNISATSETTHNFTDAFNPFLGCSTEENLSLLDLLAQKKIIQNRTEQTHSHLAPNYLNNLNNTSPALHYYAGYNTRQVSPVNQNHIFQNSSIYERLFENPMNDCPISDPRAYPQNTIENTSLTIEEDSNFMDHICC